MLVDSHAHIEGSRFATDLADVLARAKAAGVDAMLTVGQVEADWSGMEASLALAERHANVFTSVGLHPHDAKHFMDATAARMAGLARHPRVVAWGECGLDFYYDNSPRDEQREAFRAQLRLAREAGLPVIIHSRDAADETLEMLREAATGQAETGAAGAASGEAAAASGEAAAAPGAGVFHCFSYDAEVARSAVALGYYVSFSGIVTFKTSEAIKQAAAEVPLDRILVETDCPFLAPIPHRGKRNEPAYVVEVAAEIARLRGITIDEVAAATTANFYRLFPKAAPPL